mgnify:CR=1 FL=1
MFLERKKTMAGEELFLITAWNMYLSRLVDQERALSVLSSYHFQQDLSGGVYEKTRVTKSDRAVAV